MEFFFLFDINLVAMENFLETLLSVFLRPESMWEPSKLW